MYGVIREMLDPSAAQKTPMQHCPQHGNQMTSKANNFLERTRMHEEAETQRLQKEKGAGETQMYAPA